MIDMDGEEEVTWEAKLVREVTHQVAGYDYWGGRLAGLGDVDTLTKTDNLGAVVHLAILVEPYLSYILDGQKTVESRFSVNGCAPYRRVQKGDIIILKRAGGPVVGLCEVAQFWDYALEPHSWQEIRQQFTRALCAQDPEFWNDRQAAAFATLIRITHVTELAGVKCAKRDRRGWVVLTPRIEPASVEVAKI